MKLHINFVPVIITLFFLGLMVGYAGESVDRLAAPTLSMSTATFATSNVPAFPGAVGYGAEALSACHRDDPFHYRVTTRASNVDGSMEAVFKDSLRQTDTLQIVTWDSSGVYTIQGGDDAEGQITNKSCVYLTGAPTQGSGVVLRGTVSISNCDDCVFRYIRFRQDSAWAQWTDDNTNQDWLFQAGTHVMFDHNSHAFGTGTPISIYASNRDVSAWADSIHKFTFSNNIVGEPFQRTKKADPFPPINVDTLFGDGTLCATKGDTWRDTTGAWHNDSTPGVYRTDKGMFYQNVLARFDRRGCWNSARDIVWANNVIAMWLTGASNLGRKTHLYLSRNYYKPYTSSIPTRENGRAVEFDWETVGTSESSPYSTPRNYKDISTTYVTWDGREALGLFLRKNKGYGHDTTAAQWSAFVSYRKKRKPGVDEATHLQFYPDSVKPTAAITPENDTISLVIDTTWTAATYPVEEVTADSAYNLLTDSLSLAVGASKSLTCAGNLYTNQDSIDIALLKMIRDSASFVFTDLPMDQSDVSMSTYDTRVGPCTDTDLDGMPDEFEQVCGGDATSLTIGGDISGDGYVNIEEYINGTNGIRYLTWDDNSTGEDGFRIYRDVGAGFVELTTVGANVTEYTDEASNIGHRYKVVAYKGVDESSDSNIITSTCN